MSQFIVNGQKTLSGEIPVYGAKNAALKIIAGSLLSTEKITITNVPEIVELKWHRMLIEAVGGKVDYDKKTGVIEIETKDIKTTEMPLELVKKSRSSVLMVGPMLARMGKVRFPHPGGCALGQRPIDFFLDGFKKMGATVTETEQYYDIEVDGKLKGCTYYFPRISHTATESLMMTAVLAEGKTSLHNAACEPEIVALAEYLNEQGAKITGAGTHTIEIEGVEKIGAGTYNTIPDRLEAGTFAILGALLGENLKVTNIVPEHLESLWYMFDKMGVQYKLGKDFVEVTKLPKGKSYKSANIQTHEYPGFATDIQPPFTVLLTQCEGISLVHETIFDGRLFYTDLLNQMGANITMCDPHRVVVHGPSKLYGRRISSPDLRAGMALVMAAMLAEGESTIDNIYQVDRGYADLAMRLKNIGADIKRVD